MKRWVRLDDHPHMRVESGRTQLLNSALSQCRHLVSHDGTSHCPGIAAVHVEQQHVCPVITHQTVWYKVPTLPHLLSHIGWCKESLECDRNANKSGSQIGI